uniref:rRNA adenine N(6)-methyltransferase n=1 Tax=Aceria tosichella TaxID=561515 RepID=A0A6G1SCS0_9ACAR
MMRGVSALIRNHGAPTTQLQRIPLPDGSTPQAPTIEIDPELFQLKPKKLPPLPRTRDLLHVYGIRAKKNLSQNFLLNQRLIRGLVRAAGIMPGSRVIEVGPGPGNLTRAILEQSPFEVLAVEKDRRFLPLLEQLADSVLPGQLKILLGDALDHDFENIFGNPKQLESDFQLPVGLPEHVFKFSREWEDRSLPPVRLIGNLPFSISTPLLIKWLHHISLRNSFWQYGRVPMLLTFQDEVARRICANPTAYERTRLSVMSQNYCHVQYMFRISGKSFTPAAGVDTGVVRLEPRKQPLCQVPFKLFEKFNRHLFHHRNHNLNYNFRTLFPADLHDRIEHAFDKAQVNPRIFPYMISNKETARLCEEYYKLCLEIPALVEYDYRASKRLLEESTMKVLKDANLNLLTK